MIKIHGISIHTFSSLEIILELYKSQFIDEHTYYICIIHLPFPDQTLGAGKI